MDGIAIKYGDVAPEAKENFNFSANDKESFVDTEKFKEYNLQFKDFVNVCEPYSALLDGKATVFPSDTENENMGLWSESMTDENGDFESDIVITLVAQSAYSSQGLTFTFDTLNQIYPLNINIKWYVNNGSTESKLSEEDFTPDNAFYFCQNAVSNYNKVVITIQNLNMPHSRLKLRNIDYGYGTFFYGDELRNCSVLQEINPISTELSINTCDFTIDSKSNMEYSFQSKQPLSVYFNDNLIATTFVSNSKRKSKALWDIQSEDYVGMLDNTLFMGGMYGILKTSSGDTPTPTTAEELISEICEIAKVPFSLSDELKDIDIVGHLPICTCREALMQVCLAICAVADTTQSDKIDIYRLSSTVTQTIPLPRIMQGQNFDDKESVTGVKITYHNFRQMFVQEETEEMIAFDNYETGETGNGIYVEFSEPLSNLTARGDVTIVSSNVNYAIINVPSSGRGRLIGRKFGHDIQTKEKLTELASLSQLQKTVEISSSATLINKENVQNVLDNCFAYYTKFKTMNLKIVEGKHERYIENKYGTFKYAQRKYGTKSHAGYIYDEPTKVGETITAKTDYLGDITGVIISQKFGLNGNIIIKDTQVIANDN